MRALLFALMLVPGLVFAAPHVTLVKVCGMVFFWEAEGLDAFGYGNPTAFENPEVMAFLENTVGVADPERQVIVELAEPMLAVFGFQCPKAL